MGYIITVPEVKMASILPNPATINENILINIIVDEKTIELQPESRPAGTFYSGEE